MKFFILSFLVFFSYSTLAEDVYRIKLEKDRTRYEKYSKKELRKRVWQLERAVWQLQQRIFHLEGTTNSNNSDVWLCKLSPFTRSYSATGGSKAVASHKVIEKCTEGEDSGFHCKDPKCEK